MSRKKSLPRKIILSPILVIISIVVAASVGAIWLNQGVLQVLKMGQYPPIKISSDTQINQPSASPSITESSMEKQPTPTKPKTPKTISSQKAASQSQQYKVKIDSITPSVANFGDIITIRGSSFGSDSKQVRIYGPSGSQLASPIITDWSDNEIKAKVPPVQSGMIYEIQIETSAGDLSNKFGLKIGSGQPIISTYPQSAAPGAKITLTGKSFGNEKGEIKIYGPWTSTNFAGNCSINNWTDGSVECTLPASLSIPGNYGLSLITSDGRQASFVYFDTAN